MYSIGEYARIAQVSKRLLRYYDEIGLFQPVKIDSISGHRYYSASQLPELNRILALKDLGLSLNQIQRFVRDDISAAEIQGMLSLKKAELEQQVLEELQRIRTIESRLKQIQDRDNLVRDVIVKQVPQQRFVSARQVLSQTDSPDDFFWSVVNALNQGERASNGQMTIVFHEDGIEGDYIDMEFGKSLDRSSRLSLTTNNGITLVDKFLPSATMATFVPQTKNCSKLLGYNAIAEWVETNHYDLAGAVRLVFLELPKHPGDDDYVMEIQFPVCKREVDLNLKIAKLNLESKMYQNPKIVPTEMAARLSTLWIFVLFNLIFRDIHEFFRAGLLEEIITGVVNGTQVTEFVMLIGAIMVERTIVMVLLSRILNYRINRWANIIISPVMIALVIGMGQKDLDDLFFATVEIIALSVIVWLAWKWREYVEH